MGHLVDFEVIERRESILACAEEFSFINSNRQENYNGNYHGNLTIHDHIICANKDEAKAKIKELDNGWYDDHAVRFYDIPELKPTKKMERLLERVAENDIKRREYEEKHRIQHLKSKLISCNHCGSKIAKDFTHYQTCPVCHKQDLRADYIQERLVKFDKDREALLEEHKALVEAQKNKQTEKYKGKVPTKWLAKFEIHH